MKLSAFIGVHRRPKTLSWQGIVKLMAAALERFGICQLTVPVSDLPYRIDGIIALVGVAVLLVLAIVLPERRFILVFSFLLITQVALRRLGTGV